jgi:hypothetical protein
MIIFTADLHKKRRQLSALNCLIQSISPEGKHRGLQATHHSLSRVAELEKAPSVPMMPRWDSHSSFFPSTHVLSVHTCYALWFWLTFWLIYEPNGSYIWEMSLFCRPFSLALLVILFMLLSAICTLGDDETLLITEVNFVPPLEPFQCCGLYL